VIVYTDKHREPFLIDASDWPAVRRYPWCIAGNGYPYTKTGKGRASCRPLTLHEFLMRKAPDGLQWDHVNGDKLDNRRANLRAVTPAKNAQNRKRPDCRNTSGHRGVTRRRRGGWRAQITVAGRGRALGDYATLAEAVAARKAGEKRYWA